ncbi:hypothetical protein FPOA_12100 [Fusarium poae]|uniref:Uncharacterized protein n=1 Tax=Fusarium poae TaxID=36050 RepID=A0A1B8AAG0_FUSPO|nr:hypothetical protein FPOA_12100 [Fusarium poae]
MSRSAIHQRFYERLRDANAAGVYRRPLEEMPFLSSDGVEFKLSNNNNQKPSGGDNLITGDSDDSDFNESFLITTFLITTFLITTFLITTFLITTFLITTFLITTFFISR